jgi:hypothetical protein
MGITINRPDPLAESYPPLFIEPTDVDRARLRETENRALAATVTRELQAGGWRHTLPHPTPNPASDDAPRYWSNLRALARERLAVFQRHAGRVARRALDGDTCPTCGAASTVGDDVEDTRHLERIANIDEVMRAEGWTAKRAAPAATEG